MNLAIASSRLAEIVERENAALAALDLNAATGLLDAKRSAIADFELASKGVSQSLPLDGIARLRAAALRNATLIERAIAVQRRVIEMVLAATPRRLAAQRYRADAGMARAHRTAPMTLLARA